jgi:hypothetical protein
MPHGVTPIFPPYAARPGVRPGLAVLGVAAVTDGANLIGAGSHNC